MRPKATEGWPNTAARPGWPEESDPAGVILYVMDGPYRLPFPYSTGCPDRSCPAASWWNFQLSLYSKYTQPSVMSYVTQGRHGPWYSSRPMPSLWPSPCFGGILCVRQWAKPTYWPSLFQRIRAKTIDWPSLFLSISLIVVPCAIGGDAFWDPPFLSTYVLPSQEII
jgi:hypothetical protein